MLKLSIAVATDEVKLAIYRLRHEVYAVELQQYKTLPDQILPDSPDVQSDYLALWDGCDLVGFVGVTPPTSCRYSVDKHLRREEQSFPFDSELYEIRALTLARHRRSFRMAGCLMYGALRWVGFHGGRHIVSMGRLDVIDLYLRFGFQRLGPTFACGAVQYDLIYAHVAEMETRLTRYQTQLDRMKNQVNWQIDIAFSTPSSNEP